MNRYFVSLFLAASCALSAFADSAAVASFAAPAKISLQDARSAALGRSESVKRAELDVRSGSLDKTAAAAALFPSLSGSASLSASKNTQAEMTTSSSAGLSASYTVFSGGSLVTAVKSAAASYTKAEAALRAARLTALTDIDTRFLAVLKAKQTYESALSDLDAADKRLAIAKAKRAAGALAESDLTESLSTWAAKKTTATQAKYSYAASRKKLASAIGADTEIADLDETTFAESAKRVESLAASGETALDDLVAGLYEKGRETNPDLRGTSVAVDVADLAVAAKKAKYLPTVSVSASYKASSSDFSAVTTNPSVGVSASIPIFPVSDRKAAVDIAALDAASARSKLAEAEEDLYLSFYTTVLDILSASGRIESAKVAVSYAEQNHKLVLEKFKLSSTTVSSVADAEATLVSARTEEISARFDLYSSVIALARLLGEESEQGLRDALP